MDQDATWYGSRPRPWRLCVRWGTSSPSPIKGAEPPPQFPAHFCCGQMAGCTKMPLGMEVGLSPRDFVLDGDPDPSPQKEAEPPIFGPCLLWPNGWMYQDGTWHGVRPWSSPHCARWRHRSPAQKGDRTPNFRPIFIVTKRLHGSRCHLVRDIVFDVDPATPRKREHPLLPNFGPCLLWPNGWMDEDATWYGSRPRPRPRCTI